MTAILCASLLLVGLWLTFLNWRCFYLGLVRKVYSPSWIPLLAGLFLFLGIYFFPGNPMRNLAWGAFLLDWGSVPGVGHAIIFHLIRKAGGTGKQGEQGTDPD